MAHDSVIFLGWGGPKTGREAEALNVYDKLMALLTKKRTAGRIERFEPFILARHGGDLNGFVLIIGDRTELDLLVRDDDFDSLVGEMTLSLKRVGVVPGATGPGVQNQINRERFAVTNLRARP